MSNKIKMENYMILYIYFFNFQIRWFFNNKYVGSFTLVAILYIFVNINLV